VKTPAAGLIIGAFAGGLAGGPVFAPDLLSEPFGQAILVVIGFLMVPVSALVAIFTISGFRLGRQIVQGRPLGERSTVALGLTLALIFGSLVFGACLVLFEGFATTFFAGPIAGAIVGSVAGGLVATLIPRQAVATVLPLEVD
jgi:hypothetical protein